MDSTEQTTNKTNSSKDHKCPQAHCCACGGCGTICMRGDSVHGIKRYWIRHLIVLALGVIVAFCVGVRLGEMKGYIMASYTPVSSYR